MVSSANALLWHFSDVRQGIESTAEIRFPPSRIGFVDVLPVAAAVDSPRAEHGRVPVDIPALSGGVLPRHPEDLLVTIDPYESGNLAAVNLPLEPRPKAKLFDRHDCRQQSECFTSHLLSLSPAAAPRCRNPSRVSNLWLLTLALLPATQAILWSRVLFLADRGVPDAFSEPKTSDVNRTWLDYHINSSRVARKYSAIGFKRHEHDMDSVTERRRSDHDPSYSCILYTVYSWRYSHPHTRHYWEVVHCL